MVNPPSNPPPTPFGPLPPKPLGLFQNSNAKLLWSLVPARLRRNIVTNLKIMPTLPRCHQCNHLSLPPNLPDHHVEPLSRTLRTRTMSFMFLASPKPRSRPPTMPMRRPKRLKYNSVSNLVHNMDETNDDLPIAEKMSKMWTSPVYAFFEPLPSIDYVNRHRCHTFRCAAKSYKFTAQRYLDTGDKLSTGNLGRHAKTCWGKDAWKAVSTCCDAADARKSVVKLLAMNRSITAVFEHKGKGKVTYSPVQHTCEQTK